MLSAALVSAARLIDFAYGREWDRTGVDPLSWALRRWILDDRSNIGRRLLGNVGSPFDTLPKQRNQLGCLRCGAREALLASDVLRSPESTGEMLLPADSPAGRA
jgi:hypothetical protein